jgi:hypothetical protein
LRQHIRYCSAVYAFAAFFDRCGFDTTIAFATPAAGAFQGIFPTPFGNLARVFRVYFSQQSWRAADFND